MSDQLQEGRFYWALPVLDADADQEWVNEPQPARYLGGDRWLWIGYETEDWPARWVGGLLEDAAAVQRVHSAITPDALSALYEIGNMDDAPMGIDSESSYRLIEYAAGLSGLEVCQVKDGGKLKLKFKPKLEMVEFRSNCLTMTVDELRQVLAEYPGDMPVIATWERTIHGITMEQLSVHDEDGCCVRDCLVIDVDTL